MKWRSFGNWRWDFFYKYNLSRFGNSKNVSGWRYCSLFRCKYIYFNLKNLQNTSISKCSFMLYSKKSYSRWLIFSHVTDVISIISLRFKFRWESFGNTFNIFISSVLRQLLLRSSHASAVTFANVSTDTEPILQPDIPSFFKESELINWRSVGIWRPEIFDKNNLCRFCNPTNVSGWRYCSLFPCKNIF